MLFYFIYRYLMKGTSLMISMNAWKRFGIFLACLLVFPACSGLMSGPKVTPEQKAKIMSMARDIQFSTVRKLSNSKQTRMPVRTGQWLTTLTTPKSGEGDIVLSTTKIVSVKGNTVVIETERYSAANNAVRELSQITIENYPVSGRLSYSQEEYDQALSNMKIQKMVNQQGDDPPQETPAQLLAMAQGMTRSAMGNLVRVGDLKKTAAETPYLKSAQCYAYDYKVSVFGFSSSGTVIAHSEVPVHGYIRTDDEKNQTIVIAFGTKGAKAKLKY